MEFNYNGVCYFCKEGKNINKIPIGGIRLCRECLCEVGAVFLEFIGHSKERNDWEDLSTQEIIGKVLNIIYNSGYGTFYMLAQD